MLFSGQIKSLIAGQLHRLGIKLMTYDVIILSSHIGLISKVKYLRDYAEKGLIMMHGCWLFVHTD